MASTTPQDTSSSLIQDANRQIQLQLAGARRKLYFQPQTVVAGMVTCGGVCPGLNNVIRGLVNILWYRYGVRCIYGFRSGYQGMTPGGTPPLQLTPEYVKDIHQFGGTILGTSRGPQDPAVMASYLQSLKVDMVFCIGGDGTQRGALHLANELDRRGATVSVIGIGKTIDNDLLYVDRSFGFDTAVDLSQRALITCHEEARSTRNGIGIVKLMGRESGAIALHASLASGDVNVVLVPEVKFTMEALISYLKRRFETRDHCLIVCAEGAGQDLLESSNRKDASGNKVLSDIGDYLKKEIAGLLKASGVEHSIKYIDPSYSIRAGITNASDSILCTVFAQMAVHAAMAGKTSMMVGLVNGMFVHVPLSKVAEGKKNVDIRGLYWQSFCDATGSPFIQ